MRDVLFAHSQHSRDIPGKSVIQSVKILIYDNGAAAAAAVEATTVPFPPSYSSPSYPSPSLSLLRQGSRNRREEGERGKSDTAVQAVAVAPASERRCRRHFKLRWRRHLRCLLEEGGRDEGETAAAASA